jgi:hypothetical protein
VGGDEGEGFWPRRAARLHARALHYFEADPTASRSTATTSNRNATTTLRLVKSGEPTGPAGRAQLVPSRAVPYRGVWSLVLADGLICEWPYLSAPPPGGLSNSAGHIQGTRIATDTAIAVFL